MKFFPFYDFFYTKDLIILLFSYMKKEVLHALFICFEYPS